MPTEKCNGLTKIKYLYNETGKKNGRFEIVPKTSFIVNLREFNGIKFERS